MGVDGVQVRTGDVDSTQDQVCSDVAPVVEQMLLQHPESRTHTRLKTIVQSYCGSAIVVNAASFF